MSLIAGPVLRGLRTFSLVAGLATIVSCLNPSSSDSRTSPKLTTVASVLAALPSMTISVPTSLSASADSTSTRTSRSVSVVPSDEPGVKAQGWFSMNQQLHRKSIAEIVLATLKSLKDDPSLTLVFDQDITIGTKSLPTGYSVPNTGETSLDLGKLHVRKNSDNQYTVDWAMNYQNAALGISQRWTSKVVLTEDSAGQISEEIWMTNYNSSDLTTPVFQYYATYNDTTGNLTENEKGTYSGGQTYQTYISLEKSDDVYEIANRLHYGGTSGSTSDPAYDQTAVGWATDTEGGVANLYNPGDATKITLSTEFYDSDGFLVQSSYGTRDLFTDQLALYTPANHFVNLATLPNAPSTPPSTVTVTYSGSSSHWTSGTAVSLPTGATGGVYFQRTEGTWASGDATYSATSFSGQTVTFDEGYVIPSTVMVGNAAYYIDNQFPLRYLRVSDSGYSLMRQDGTPTTETSVYYDDNGNRQTSTYTWTPETWWLDNQSSGSQTGTGPEAGIDISLDNIWDTDFYYYDATRSTWVRQKAYVNSSSFSTPLHFTFAKTELVSNVATKLKTLFADKEAALTTLPTITSPGLSEFPTP